jgi:hypothetical protein
MMTEKKYQILYYESAEDMVPDNCQIHSENQFAQYGQPTNRYNWNNIKRDEILSTSVGDAYLAFTLGHPSYIVVGVEDVRANFPSTVVA